MPSSFPSQRRRCQRGASLIAFTVLTAFVIIPLLGLAIDASIEYWVKVRLSSAVDAAALSAARSLNVGSTIASQIANAQMVGRQYFAANFPAGIMGAIVFGGAQVANSASITVTPTANVVTVNANAQVRAPLYFMRYLGINSGVISASSQATRRNANIVLVLDRSGSMNNSSNSCQALVSAVEGFTNKFIDGRDQIGLITFSTTAKVDYSPSYNFKTASTALNSVIDNMLCVGATSTAQGLTLGYQQVTGVINQPGALNVILFFTDGQANEVVATYPVKTSADTRYDYVNTGTLVATPASSCASSVASSGMSGGYTDFSRSVNATGATGGVLTISPAPDISSGSSTPPVINASNCSFTKSGRYGAYNPYQGRADVAYIPAQDAWGNLTTGFKALDTFPSGLGPYTGKIRSDSPGAIRYAAMNAADSIAQKIRADPTYNIVTYSIGLAGNEPMPMDTDFMERIANDARASNFDPNQQQGLFMLASDNASLSDAFNAIASQVLRLSK